MKPSGEKTEKATPKKRKDERKKGNIMKSQDLCSSIVLFCVFGSLRFTGGFIGDRVVMFVNKMLTPEKGMLDYRLTPQMTQRIFVGGIIDGAIILLPILAVVLVSTTVIQLAQTRFLFTSKTLEIKLERLSPANGIKRVFSHKSVAELVKSLIKITIVLFFIYNRILANIQITPHILALPVSAGVEHMFTTAFDIALMCSALLVGMSILDLFYQWWSHEKELKMTKQEVKDEHKNIEGDPLIKSRISQKQREMSRARMIAEVPKADVVITNPSHVAVALKYDSKEDRAPIILAMGQDYLARKIKEIAKENKIAIVENVELARALYKAGEVGKPIPVDFYRSVAGVLAYVAGLKDTGRRGGR